MRNLLRYLALLALVGCRDQTAPTMIVRFGQDAVPLAPADCSIVCSVEPACSSPSGLASLERSVPHP